MKKIILFFPLLIFRVIFLPTINLNASEYIPNAICEDPDNCYPGGYNEFSNSTYIAIGDYNAEKTVNFLAS